MNQSELVTRKLPMLLCLAVTLVASTFAQNNVVVSKYQNPNQLAEQSWFKANTSAVLTGTYYNFSNPVSLAFDGEHVWASHGVPSVDNLSQLDKIRASDGALIGTYTIGNAQVLSQFAGNMAFDGVNIWVTEHNPGSNLVHQIRAADGAYITSCNLGTPGFWPNTPAFDGTNMWVGTNTGFVVKFSPTSCAVLCSANVGGRVYDEAFDGTSMWATNFNNNTVTPISSSCGVGTPVSVPGGPIGIVYDGTNLWTANQTSNKISRIALPSTTVTSYNVGILPQYITYDGANVWVTNITSGTVNRVSTTNPGTQNFSFTACGSTSSGPFNTLFDGAHIWVGCANDSLGKM